MSNRLCPVVLAAFLFFACSGDEAAVATPPPPPAPDTEPAAVPAPVSALSAGKPAEYSGKWVVILGSNKKPGVIPDGIDVANPPDGVVTLDSTEFKGLSPCYEVVVAGGFTAMRDAVAKSNTLKAEGIDNYAKKAGKWVGKQPAVTAFCEGELEPSTAVCPENVRFVEEYAGRSFVHLGLNPVLQERILEGAPPPKTLEGASSWISLLPNDVVGDFKKGESLGIDEACTITGFVALTRGRPHFGWYQNTDQKSPAVANPWCSRRSRTAAAPSSAATAPTPAR